MLTMKAQVKSVTANVAKKTVSFSFTMPMDDESLQTAESLAFYVDKSLVTVMVEPRQMSFNVKQDEEKGE